MPAKTKAGKVQVSFYISKKELAHLRKQDNQSTYIENLIAADMAKPTLNERVQKLEGELASFCKNRISLENTYQCDCCGRIVQIGNVCGSDR